MATIDFGGSGTRRAVNHELPLVPFIDFLLCIVAFLLVTAVWSEMARLDASAKVPAAPGDVAPAPTPELHVDMRAQDHFVLAWRQGSTVLAQEDVRRAPSDERLGTLRFPELSRGVQELWTRAGLHRAPTDPSRDRAVLHTSNVASFEEIVAAMDAIAGTRRAATRGTSEPAFDVVFAVD